MLVEDFIIPGPQFVRKIGTHGNEPVKLRGIADRPGKATGKKHGKDDTTGVSRKLPPRN